MDCGIPCKLSTIFLCEAIFDLRNCRTTRQQSFRSKSTPTYSQYQSTLCLDSESSVRLIISYLFEFFRAAERSDFTDDNQLLRVRSRNSEWEAKVNFLAKMLNQRDTVSSFMPHKDFSSAFFSLKQNFIFSSLNII